MLDYETSKTRTLPVCVSKSGSWGSPSSLCCTVRYLTRKYNNFNRSEIFRAHINRLAALISRALATGWAVYTTWRGPTFEANFQELIAGSTSPCSLDIFSIYWRTREVYEVRIHEDMYSIVIPTLIDRIDH